MVEPLVTLVWMEFTAVKLRLVRPVKETQCKVTDRVSHVKPALTMSEGKAEKESDCCGSHVKRVLTRMRGAKGTEEHVLTIRSMACGAPLLKDTMSAVELREGLEVSASDLVGYGMVSHVAGVRER